MPEDKSTRASARPGLFVRFLRALSPRTVGGVLVLVVLIGVLVAGSISYQKLRAKQQEVEKLNQIVQRLAAERRVAQVVVRDQKKNAAGKVLATTLKFVEVDEQEQPISEKILTVPGQEVYFDALVIKFDHEYVKLGDPLRGKSLFLFRKVFGSGQKPEEGVPLDVADEDGIPASYRTDAAVSAFEKDLWKQFWQLASDPVAAEKTGVRVAQIEAPAKPLVPGMIYIITLDAAGGLNIKPVKIPAVLRGEPVR